MAKLVPWDSVAPMTIKVSAPSIDLRPIKPNKFILWRNDFLRRAGDFIEWCETQPRVLFWGSCFAAALLLTIFAFIFDQADDGYIGLAAGFLTRFGLVLGLLAIVELVRGKD